MKRKDPLLLLKTLLPLSAFEERVTTTKGGSEGKRNNKKATRRGPTRKGKHSRPTNASGASAGNSSLTRMAEALVRLLHVYTQSDFTPELNKAEDIFLKYRENHGMKRELAYRKLIFTFVRRYYLYQTAVYTDKPVPGMKLDKDGFPIRFLFLKAPKRRADANHVRCVLSILSMYRVMYSSDWDVKTITDARTMRHCPTYEARIIEKGFKNKWLSKRDKFVYKGAAIYTSKAGPNGPSLKNYLSDYFNLRALNMKQAVKDVLYSLSPKGTLPAIDRTFDLLDLGYKYKPDEGEKLKVGALGLKPEGGGKVRVYAMVDYWSQSALRPIHTFLDTLLKTLPTDGTFNQEALAEKVKGWTRERKIVNSFDLSGATDRLPMTLQAVLMMQLLGKKFADAWQRLLVDRDYYLKGKPIRYAVGQPMGAYSSWPSMALTHHCIVRFCKATEYGILGDDVSIVSAPAATAYKEVMRKLGVGINETKSILHNPKYPRTSTAEIAKRLFVNGTEVTPIPMKLLKQAINHPALMALLLKTLELRGYRMRRFRSQNLGRILEIYRFFGWLYREKPAKVLKLQILMRSPLSPFETKWVGEWPHLFGWYQAGSESSFKEVIYRMTSYYKTRILQSLGELTARRKKDLLELSHIRAQENYLHSNQTDDRYRVEPGLLSRIEQVRPWSLLEEAVRQDFKVASKEIAGDYADSVLHVFRSPSKEALIAEFKRSLKVPITLRPFLETSKRKEVKRFSSIIYDYAKDNGGVGSNGLFKDPERSRILSEIVRAWTRESWSDAVRQMDLGNKVYRL